MAAIHGGSGDRVRQRVARRRTDWFRILADLQYAGVNNLEVCRRLTATLGRPISSSTLRQWKQGCEPAHYVGDALLLIWTDVCGVAISQRPMTCA